MTWTRKGQIGWELQTRLEGVEYSAWPGTDGGQQITSTQAHTGTYSLRSSGHPPMGVAWTDGSEFHIRGGFYFRHEGLLNSGSKASIFLIATDTGAEHYMAWHNDDDLLHLYIDGVDVAQISTLAAGITTTGQWYHVGVNFKASTTVGFLSVYIDGVQIFNYTGDTGIDEAIGFFAGGIKTGSTSAWSNYFYLDDLYVDAGAGESDGLVPSRRFLWSAVDAGHPTAEWSVFGAADGYLAVDDGVPDDDTTYIYAEAAGLDELFAHAGVTLPANYRIRAIIPTVYARKSDVSVASTLRVLVVTSAEDVSAELILADVYGPAWELFELRPQGGQWSESDFNGCNIGVRSDGVYS